MFFFNLLSLIAMNISKKLFGYAAMNDIINTLETAVLKNHKSMLELHARVVKMDKDATEVGDELKILRVDAKAVFEQAGHGYMTDYVEKKFRSSQDHKRRVAQTIAQYQEMFPKLLYYVKQVQVQVAMLRAQVKFHGDVLVSPEVIEPFTDNIKLVNEILQTMVKSISDLQHSYAMARETVNQMQALAEDVRKRMIAVQNGETAL
jgi:hypothetical protein